MNDVLLLLSAWNICLRLCVFLRTNSTLSTTSATTSRWCPTQKRKLVRKVSHLWNAVSFHRWCIHKHTLLSALFTPVGLTRGRFTSSVTALTSCNMTCWSFLLWMFLNTEFCPVWILQVHRQGTSWLADPQQCGGAHIRTKFAHWGETRDPVTVNKCALYNQN